MQAIFQRYLHHRIAVPYSPLAKGIGWGMISGLVATLIMDLILIALFAAIGIPPFTCFSIVGETVARVFSLQDIALASIILLGISAHYIVGPVIGAIFGAAAVKAAALRVNSQKKGIICAILCAEIISQPLVALAPIFLQMTAFETLQWFGGAIGMHLIWGCALGLIWSRGMRLPVSTNRNGRNQYN